MRCLCLCEIPRELVTSTRCLYGLFGAFVAEALASSASASAMRLRFRVCFVREAGGMVRVLTRWRVLEPGPERVD